MKKLKIIYPSVFSIFILLFSCNGEKEIDVALPEYESKLVVECYLEPGKPLRLLLTESVSYFEEPQSPTIANALVTITSNEITDTLSYMPEYFDIETNRYYNYADTQKTVSYDYDKIYQLNIWDQKGRFISGTTKILPPVAIDKVEFDQNPIERFSVITEFTDDQSKENYYRSVVALGTTPLGNKADFAFSDALFNTPQIATGTRYQFGQGDAVHIWLYHIDKSYHDFLQSISDAQQANGNPFAQPAMIKSNVTGGLGIFAGMSYDFRLVNVP